MIPDTPVHMAPVEDFAPPIVRTGRQTDNYDLGSFILPKKKVKHPDGQLEIQPYKPPIVSDSSTGKNVDFYNGGTPYGNDIAQAIPVQNGVWGPAYGDDAQGPIIRTGVKVPPFVSTTPTKSVESFPVETWTVHEQPTDIPVGPPVVVATPAGPLPGAPPATLPPSGPDIATIADIYGNLFPGGGDSTIPPPNDAGPVLLYPVTYQRDVTAAKSAGPNPLIFVAIAAVLLVGWFLYKRYKKTH